MYRFLIIQYDQIHDDYFIWTVIHSTPDLSDILYRRPPTNNADAWADTVCIKSTLRRSTVQIVRAPRVPVERFITYQVFALVNFVETD